MCLKKVIEKSQSAKLFDIGAVLSVLNDNALPVHDKQTCNKLPASLKNTVMIITV